MEMNYFKEAIPEYTKNRLCSNLHRKRKPIKLAITAKQHGALVTISFGPKPMIVSISDGKKWKDEVKGVQYRTWKYHNAVVIVRCAEQNIRMKWTLTSLAV